MNGDMLPLIAVILPAGVNFFINFLFGSLPVSVIVESLTGMKNTRFN